MRQINKESSVIMKLKTTEYLGENRAEIGCCREKIRLLIQKNMLTGGISFHVRNITLVDLDLDCSFFLSWRHPKVVISPRIYLISFFFINFRVQKPNLFPCIDYQKFELTKGLQYVYHGLQCVYHYFLLRTLSLPVRISAMKYQMGTLCFARQQLVTLWYAIGLNTVMRLNTTLKQELQFA